MNNSGDRDDFFDRWRKMVEREGKVLDDSTNDDVSDPDISLEVQPDGVPIFEDPEPDPDATVEDQPWWKTDSEEQESVSDNVLDERPHWLRDAEDPEPDPDVTLVDQPFWKLDSEEQDSDFESYEQKEKKNYFRPIFGSIIAIAALAAIVFGIYYLVTPNAGKVQKWVKNSNHEKLEKFLVGSSGWMHKDGKKADTYLLALTEAIKLDQNRYEKVFLERYNQASDWQRVDILKSVNAIQINPGLLLKILLSYTNSDGSMSYLSDQFSQLERSLSKHSSEVADGILVASVRNGPQEYDIETIRRNINLFSSFDNDDYPLFSLLVEKMSEFESLESIIRDAPSTKNRIIREIESAESELRDAQNQVAKSFVLNCWIVGYNDSGYYEVELNPFGFGGVSRALLKTVTFEYTTRGHASLRVVRLGSEDVRLKEKYGGFRQDWPVYMEDSSYYKNLQKIASLKSSISSYQSQLQNHDRTISETEYELQNLKDEIIDLVNSTDNS